MPTPRLQHPRQKCPSQPGHTEARECRPSSSDGRSDVGPSGESIPQRADIWVHCKYHAGQAESNTLPDSTILFWPLWNLITYHLKFVQEGRPYQFCHSLPSLPSLPPSAIPSPPLNCNDHTLHSPPPTTSPLTAEAIIPALSFCLLHQAGAFTVQKTFTPQISKPFHTVRNPFR